MRERRTTIRVDADKDIRSREFMLVVNGGRIEVYPPDSLGNVVPPVENGITILRIAFEDAEDFARQLMDCLAAVGVRVPSASAEIRRMEDHLADMRAIAMKLPAKENRR